MDEDHIVYLSSLTEGKAETVFEWQTDPKTRKYFRNPEPPAWDEHVSWIHKMVDADNEHLFIMRYREQDAGMVRLSPYEEQGHIYEVSILVAPDMYGKGIASRTLDIINARFLEARLIAEIHKDNAQSIRLFEKCGFVKTGEDGIWLSYEKAAANV